MCVPVLGQQEKAKGHILVTADPREDVHRQVDVVPFLQSFCSLKYFKIETSRKYQGSLDLYRQVRVS